MRQHCVGQLLLFISEKQGTATTKCRSIIYLDYLVLVKKKKKKKQVDVNLLFVKLYCSSTLNYLHSITVIQHDFKKALPCVSSRTQEMLLRVSSRTQEMLLRVSSRTQEMLLCVSSRTHPKSHEGRKLDERARPKCCGRIQKS